MSKNKIDNDVFIITKINKLVAKLEIVVQQVFAELSEEELEELIENNLGEIVFDWKGQAQEEKGRRNEQKLIDSTLGKIR
jgi:hypothetical protein|tara:strand:- start:111 stop:350 length:240 start_codon:yes stop_codon:yes gene_type:complete